MDKPVLFNRVYNDDILDRCKEIQIELEETPYEMNGKKIPRVTSILSSMLSEEFLLAWANSVGLYQHKSYTYYRNKATNIGSAVHEAICMFIQEGKVSEFNELRNLDEKDAAKKSFSAFYDWWSVIQKNRYQVILQEAPMITDYCGGTLDLFMAINGRKYLIDFKTSSQLGFKYYLQLAAYRRMLFDVYGYTCDGCILLRLDKKSGKYQEVILDLNNYNDLEFMNDCDRTFISLLYAYYNRMKIESNHSYVG